MVEPTQAASLANAVARAVDRLGTLRLTDQSRRAFEKAWGRFRDFAAARGVVHLEGIDAELVRAFVHARHAGGGEPSVVAMHWRRSALRLLFRVWRGLGIPADDPTLDLVLPPRSRLIVRPLTDDELAVCRWASLITPGATRLPAIWALAEAGATTGEIPHVLVSHVRLDLSEVWLAGSTRTEPRSVPLTEWGVAQLARRIDELGNQRALPVAYEGAGSPQSAQASASGAIGDVLRRAGLAGEPDVRPCSVTAWVGRKVFDGTGRIELVAKRLGLRSLDRVAALINWDWRT